MTIKAYLVDYYTNPAIHPSVEAMFTVTIENPCLTTSLSFDPTTFDPITVLEMIYNFDDPDLVQQLVAEDTASTNYGDKDGLTLCGSRLYSITPISPETTLPEYLTQNGDTLTISTTDQSEILAPAVHI